MKKFLIYAFHISIATSTIFAQDDANSKKDNPLTEEEQQAIEDGQSRLEIITKSAREGRSKSQLLLGNLYFQGVQNQLEQDYSLAVFWYTKAADQNNARAYFNLGICYDTGKGVEKDEKKALELYIKAADRDIVEAQLNAGLKLEKLKKYKKAAHYLELAAKSGNSFAMRRCAEILLKLTDKDKVRAIKILKIAAKNNDVKSQKILATCYRDGVGVPANFSLAKDWLTTAASLNDADALFQVATLYKKGIMVEVDTKRAFRLFIRSAKLNFAPAQVATGECYYFGSGVSQNHEKAFTWFNSAADQQLPEGLFYLGMCYLLGHGCEKNAPEAFSIFEEAANLNHIESMNNLAYLYETGNGCEKDVTLAIHWYKQAIEKKSENAILNLAELYLNKKHKYHSIEKANALLDSALKKGLKKEVTEIREKYKLN